MGKSETYKNIRAILSVILGFGVGTATYLCLIIFFFSVGLVGWSDGGEESYLNKLEITTKVFNIFSLIAGFAIAISIIIRMNRSKVRQTG